MTETGTGHVTAVCGPRTLEVRSQPEVELAVATAIGAGATELRFGGAEGADTVALRAAGSLARGGGLELVAVVPHTIEGQPRAAREALKRYAGEVRELGGPRRTVSVPPWRGRRHGAGPLPCGGGIRHISALLEGASRLLAFVDGHHGGGTACVVAEALHRGIEVDLVEVRSSTPVLRRWDTVSRQPPLLSDGLTEKDATLDRYRSLRSSHNHKTSCQVRRLLAGQATPEEAEGLADRLAALVSGHPQLREAAAVAPVPGRRPGEPSPLIGLARALARRTGKELLESWIVHVADPNGSHRAFGIPSKVEDHARALRVCGPAPGRVLVLDAVWPVGGALEGAALAVEEATGTEPVGLAVLRVEAEGKPRGGGKKRRRRRRPRRLIVNPHPISRTTGRRPRRRGRDR